MSEQKFKLNTPTAILIAGVMIAVTIALTTKSPQKVVQPTTNTVSQAQQAPPNDTKYNLNNLLPINETDHVRGSENPKITIVEYSDYECPFCKRFHETMQSIIEQYGDDVAWVYRHWPIEGLHPVKARREALAAECAADQQGSEAFWRFSDRFFELTPSNNRTNLEKVLPQIANEMDLNLDEFNSCIETEKFAEKVDRDAGNAVTTGGRGTPWSVIILPDENKVPLNGAQPEKAISQLIESVLAN